MLGSPLFVTDCYHVQWPMEIGIVIPDLATLELQILEHALLMVARLSSQDVPYRMVCPRLGDVPELWLWCPW